MSVILLLLLLLLLWDGLKADLGMVTGDDCFEFKQQMVLSLSVSLSPPSVAPRSYTPLVSHTAV